MMNKSMANNKIPPEYSIHIYGMCLSYFSYV